MTSTLRKSYRILVSGYFGYNNIGDEAILKGLIDGIRAKSSDVDIVVLSKNPDWTRAKYNVIAVDRSNVFDIITAVKKCDMLVSGGGSLLQDVTSKKSILYYLFILKLAMIFKKKTFIYSQGIGPISLKLNKTLTRRILNKVSFINVRDNQSARVLKELGVDREILVTTDTVFGINKPSKDEGKEILKDLGVREGVKNLALTIIDWKSYRQRSVDEIVIAVEKILEERDVNVILIPFFYHVDLDIETEIYKRLKSKYDNIYLVEEYLHIERYLSLVGNMDVMLSMRLHGLIFATLMGAYPIGISYDPKIDGFMKELDRIQNHYVEDFKGVEVSNDIIKSLDNLERLKAETDKYLEKFYYLTDRHNNAVIEVLKRWDMEKVSIFGVNIFNIDFNEATEIVKNFLKEDKIHKIYTPNTEIVMEARDNEEIRAIINSGDLIIADGIGLIYGSRMKKKPLKERVTGFDISMELIDIANKEGYSLYLLGAKPGVAKRAAENLKKDYPNLNVVGHHDGYFKGTHIGMKNHEEEIQVIEEINSLKPDIIFLGLGFPKQELWINEYANKLNSKLIIGNGGVIDIISGDMKRAPDIFIKLNLEWFYRLITNPSRIKRQLAIPKFLIAIIVDKNSVKWGG